MKLGSVAGMEMHPCPRCGTPVIANRTGRPRVWCTDDCRRRGHETNIPVAEIVRERTVVRPERVSTERQIARLLDDPDATELLLRTLAHRWRHRSPHDDPAAHQRLAPLVLDLWQGFHAPTDPNAAPPPKLPTAAAELRVAVEKVMSSPRSIRDVLTRVRAMLDTNQIPPGNQGEPIRNGLAYLMTYRGPRR
jgi:uncharacterized Zn finger protein (UPF0148 family)